MDEIIKNTKILDESIFPFLKEIKLFLKRDPYLHSCYLSSGTMEDIKYDTVLTLIVVVDKDIAGNNHILKKYKDEIVSFFYPSCVKFYTFSISKLHIEKYKTGLCFNTLFWFGKEDLRQNVQCTLKDMNFKERAFFGIFANNLDIHRTTASRALVLPWLIQYLYIKNIEKMNRISYSHKDMFMDISNNANIQKIDKLICSETYNLVHYNCCCDTKNTEFFFFLKDYLTYCEGKKTIDEIRKNDYGHYNKLLKELK